MTESRILRLAFSERGFDLIVNILIFKK